MPRPQLDEWLVYDGICRFGTVRQRIIATFILVDTSHDGKLQRVEIDQMFRLVSQLTGKELAEVKIFEAVNKVMQGAKDVCTISHNNFFFGSSYSLLSCVLWQRTSITLRELLEAAQKDPVIRGLMSLV